MTRAYRLLNVFALPGDPFSGNPLAVVEDATGLTPQTCQAIARQFNLSESTFVTAGRDGTDATVRIFTPTIELPFAGHPTLGTAAVVAESAGREQVVLGMPAGPIPVARADGLETVRWLGVVEEIRPTSDPASGSFSAAMYSWSTCLLMASLIASHSVAVN